MSEKELNNCNCHDEESKGCGCGGHDHNHDHNHECGCGCGEEEHESFVVDLEDENGNVISCDVVDAFEYNDKEYVLVQNPQDSSVYLFESHGEEGELSVPDEAEFEEVTKYYQDELANL